MREAAGRRRRFLGFTRRRRSGSPGWSGWGVLGCSAGEKTEKEVGREPGTWEGPVCFWDGEGPG